MSLKPMSVPPVPSETMRVARAAFPKGNLFTPPTLLPLPEIVLRVTLKILYNSLP